MVLVVKVLFGVIGVELFLEGSEKDFKLDLRRFAWALE
jgi:hypothetical protein